MTLTGKTALVTGAARGIGLAIATRLAADGARVALLDQDADAAETAAGGIGRGALALAGDVTRARDVDAAVARVEGAWGRLDVLVNNAGITGRSFPIWELTDEDWQRVIDVDLTSVFLCCRAAVKVMLRQGSGRIINIASIAGKGYFNTSNVAYAASKGAVISLTKTAAQQLGKHNINVNAICPGFFPSKMTKVTLDRIGAGVLALTPLGRLGGDEDLKGSVVFLASEASRHITGQALAVDGGCTAI
jgi:NAD(P)-dependent dehydrogenase (short-subunit alcohol dehydrogenase family)